MACQGENMNEGVSQSMSEEMSAADEQDGARGTEGAGRTAGQAACQDLRRAADVEEPPRSVGGILRQIGPGLIIAANIVGSGELIMTTRTGATAGIGLLWLILVGCMVKVFVQLELGRFSISSGETTLTALSRVPGPRVGRLNWVVLLWAVMAVTTVGQLGGIVGGVSQAAAITIPITGDYQETMRCPAASDIVRRVAVRQQDARSRHLSWVDAQLNELDFARRAALLEQAQRVIVCRHDPEEHARQKAVLESMTSPGTWDDRIWAVMIGAFTAVILFFGRYHLIQNFSVALVVSFTFLTIGNVVALQTTGYALSKADFVKGLSFGLPDTSDAVVTALATFGIIGVGASELVMYPYWCLEKGYARAAGPREPSDAWLQRAAGWIRVMRYDAFTSMIIYTLSTAAFFLMGAAVLHRDGRTPDNSRLVATLAESYVPVFGTWGRLLLLAGAVSVLYSTYLVANASNARIFADFTGVAGLTDPRPDSRQRQTLVRALSFALPVVCVVIFLVVRSPLLLIMISGICQSLLLPVLGLSALYFRWKETDIRLHPGRLWDAALVLSCVAMFIVGGWGVYRELSRLMSGV